MNKIKIEKECWIIVSKDRKLIAKGVPRNRYLVDVDDEKDKKRILTYTSEAKAKNAFISCGFYGEPCGSIEWRIKNLETIKCRFVIEEI